MTIVQATSPSNFRHVSLNDIALHLKDTWVGPSIVRIDEGGWVIFGNGAVVSDGTAVVVFEDWVDAGQSLNGAQIFSFIIQHHPTVELAKVKTF